MEAKTAKVAFCENIPEWVQVFVLNQQWSPLENSSRQKKGKSGHGREEKILPDFVVMASQGLYRSLEFV